MALLDIFGDTPSYYGGLLGEEELQRARDYAQQQALQNSAMALLQAGAPSRTPGGGALAIAQGLQMGQQAYKQAMQQGLEDKLNAMKVGQMLQDLKSQQQMKDIFPQVFKQVESPEIAQPRHSTRPSRALRLAFLTMLMALCRPSSALIGSMIIFAQPFPT